MKSYLMVVTMPTKAIREVTGDEWLKQFLLSQFEAFLKRAGYRGEPPEMDELVVESTVHNFELLYSATSIFSVRWTPPPQPVDPDWVEAITRVLNSAVSRKELPDAETLLPLRTMAIAAARAMEEYEQEMGDAVSYQARLHMEEATRRTNKGERSSL